MRIHATHVGTATLLLELPGFTILTDPVLDGPGRAHFGWGMRSRRERGPHLPAEGLPPVDLVLLSHHHHADNLDTAGRAVLGRAGLVVTTRAGAARLGGGAVGLEPFEHRDVPGPLGLRVTATPARHGPPLSRPLVGPVIGFAIEWRGQERGVVYVSGDTVWFGGVAEVARRFRVGTAFLHLGGAAYGPLRFTMDAREGARAAEALGAGCVVPIHYDEWTHFKDPPAGIEPAFAARGLRDRLRLLPKGGRTELEV